MDGNPFASPPPGPPGGAAASPPAMNPFDPMAPPPADPFLNQPPPQQQAPPPSSTGAMHTPSGHLSMSANTPQTAPPAAGNPFGPVVGTSAPSPYGVQPQVASPAATDPGMMAASPYPQQPQPFSQGGPYGGPTAASPYETAMVPSALPSNPYGGVVPQHNQFGDTFSAGQQPNQAIVASSQQSNQWAVGPPGSAPSPSAAASFDPFAAPPPPAPVPNPPPPFAQAPDDFMTSTPQQHQPPPPAQNHGDDLGPFGESPAPPPPKPVEPAPEPSQYQGPDEPLPGQERMHPPQYEFGQREDPASRPDHDPDVEDQEVRARYREELARRAPPGASPLPKAELVRKKGYVLSRISFRTIVMKKWKQSYWVQYGPHTMLWFRSEADFKDWLNNPYHDQAQRNFLIKLAVNFVHDLYKPNVRGYQVTQCRTKGYGNKMVRQFKLERWMDYGPTIAAAFGSYNPREVDELREALVECMRNTPLNSGIRATGAVRQQQEEQQHRDGHSSGTYSYTDTDWYLWCRSLRYMRKILIFVRYFTFRKRIR